MNRHKEHKRHSSPRGQRHLEKSLVANSLAPRRRKAPKPVFRHDRNSVRKTPSSSLLPEVEARLTVVTRREVESAVDGDVIARTLSLIIHGFTLIAFGVIA